MLAIVKHVIDISFHALLAVMLLACVTIVLAFVYSIVTELYDDIQFRWRNRR